MENSLGIKKNIGVVGIPLVKITKIQSRIFFSLYGKKRKGEWHGKQLYVQKFHFGPYGKNKNMFQT